MKSFFSYLVMCAFSLSLLHAETGSGLPSGNDEVLLQRLTEKYRSRKYDDLYAIGDNLPKILREDDFKELITFYENNPDQAVSTLKKCTDPLMQGFVIYSAWNLPPASYFKFTQAAVEMAEAKKLDDNALSVIIWPTYRESSNFPMFYCVQPASREFDLLQRARPILAGIRVYREQLEGSIDRGIRRAQGKLSASEKRALGLLVDDRANELASSFSQKAAQVEATKIVEPPKTNASSISINLGWIVWLLAIIVAAGILWVMMHKSK